MRRFHISYVVVLAIQLLVLVAGAIFYGKSRPSIIYDQDDFLLARGEIVEQQGFYIDTTYDGTEHRISTPVFRLDKGIFEAFVSYHVENEDQFTDYSRVVSVPAGNSVSFPLSDRLEEQYSVLCDKIPLRNYQPSISYRFYVKSQDAPLALICYLDKVSDKESAEENQKWVLVRSVQINYLNVTSALRFILQWLSIFGILDVLILIIKSHSSRAFILKHKWVIASLTSILVLSEIPMLLPYIPEGGDLFFHMLRLGGLAQGLSNGAFPVKIQPIWNNGYGDAVGVMYGDLLLLIPALLYNAGFTIDFAYKLYIFLINVGTIIACFVCGRKVFRNTVSSVIATAFYVLSPFRLCDLYARAAVGEHTAMMFLPVIVLGIYLLYDSSSADSEHDLVKNNGWIILALGYFGIVTSHVLSIIMVTAYLGLFALIQIKQTLSKEVFFGLVKAASLALLLSAYFLVPFVDYYIHVPMKVTASVRGIYSSSAASLPQIFGLPLEREPHQASPLYGVIIFTALFLFFKKPEIRSEKKFGSVLFLAIVSIWLSSNYFPFALMNHIIPLLYQKGMESMQFPWRWLTISSILCFLLLGWCVDFLTQYSIQPQKRIALWAILFGIICCQSYVYTDILCRESKPYDYMNVSVTNAWGWAYEIQREYAFQNLQVEAVYDADIVHDEGVLISNVIRKGLDFKLNAHNTSDTDRDIVFPMFNYKGFKAVLSDGTEIPVEIGPYHKIKLTIPATVRWEDLHVYFCEPVCWRIAEGISSITAMALIICFACYQWRKHVRVAV